MTPRVRLAWIPFVVSLAASPAAANVPSPPNCTVDPVLAGDSNGMAIIHPFTVVVRDINGIPIAGSLVSLRFAGTVRPYTAQNPPLAVTCPFVVRNADPAARAIFAGIRFGGFANAPAIQVTADGVVLANVLARSTDIDADGVTGIIDFSIFRNNYLNLPTAQETDFDRTGLTDIGDFSIFRQVYLNDVPGTPCP